MSKSDRAASIFAFALMFGALPGAHAAVKYNLGREATPAEIAGWNIDVRPDGQGLPKGQGSVSQGNDIYDANCASCHGTFGESNSYLALTGGKGSLGTSTPVSSVGSKLNYATTLYDYINRAMPFPHSKSLTADQVYAVTAYVLNLNDIVPADFVANQDTLPKVKMPNRHGFKPYPGLMSIHGKPDVHNTACMKNCEKDVKVTASLPKGFVKNMYGDMRDNFRGLATMNEQAPPASTLPGGGATAGPSSKDGAKLFEAHGCVACHAVDHKIVGPAFRDVAAKYHGKSDAVAYLMKKIHNGGSGVWGDAPMPPQVTVSDADLKILVDWVLAQKAAK